MGTLGRHEASFNTKERPRNPRCRREAGVSTTRALTVQGTPTRPTRAPPPASPPATPTTTTGEGMASTPPPPAAPRPRGARRTPPTPTTTLGPLQLQPRASRQGRARQGPGGAPLLSTARCGARTACCSLSSEVASDLSKTWLVGPVIRLYFS